MESEYGQKRELGSAVSLPEMCLGQSPSHFAIHRISNYIIGVKITTIWHTRIANIIKNNYIELCSQKDMQKHAL